VFRLIIVWISCNWWALAADAPAPFDAKLAARYLDERATWWVSWQNAARDHDTFCISCHTALPYILGRPALRRALGERTFAAPEEQILQNVRKRVQRWSDAQPFYTDKSGAGKAEESRNTEAVLNALILSDSDRRSGVFTPETKRALDNMLAMQLKEGESAGAWTWLNFHNQPWEAEDSEFMGTALAMGAVGNAPDDYRNSPRGSRVDQTRIGLCVAHGAISVIVKPHNAALGICSTSRLDDAGPQAGHSHGIAQQART